MSDGVCYSEAISIAQILNSHFCSVASKLAEHFASIVGNDNTSTVLPLNDSIQNPKRFSFDCVTTEYVEQQLSTLQTTKATGLYRISARLLKDASSVIAARLAKICNYSLSTATFPSLWKIGRVTALHKQGDRTDMNNRQAARTCSTSPTVPLP